MRVRWLGVTLAAFAGIEAPTFAADPGSPPSRADVPPAFGAPRGGVITTFRALPLAFEAFAGAPSEGFRFIGRAAGVSVLVAPREASLILGRGTTPPETVRLRLLGANPDPVAALTDALPGRSHYLVGRDPSRHRRHVARYGRVEIDDVYDGVDLAYHGAQGGLEYDFTVRPGADPRSIRLGIAGASKMAIDERGDLVLSTPSGELVQRAPVIYQETGSARVPVAGRFVLREANEVGFEVAAYDPTRPLVIDPILSYSSYLGGAEQDVVTGVAVDAAGAVYLTGRTTSADFPVTPASLDTECSPTIYCGAAFVTKLDPRLPPSEQLVYSTFLGSDGDNAAAIAIDAERNVYVAGTAHSEDFPTTPGVFQEQCATHPFCSAGFVAKLSADGSSLVYATYLGGGFNVEWGTAPFDEATGIAVNPAGQAFVVGNTNSKYFPVTANGYQKTFGGSRDAFVARLAADGTSLVYATYLGGLGSDQAYAVALDASGRAHVVGETESDNFPVAQALQPTRLGRDAFVTTLGSDGSTLAFSTFLGGSRDDFAQGVATDSTGATYVVGLTQSLDFPTVNPVQVPSGSFVDDAFASKIAPDGSSFSYSTYLGGPLSDWGSAVAVDAAGSAYVAGMTRTFDAVEAFVTRLGPAGSLASTTVFGGSNVEFAHAVALGFCEVAWVAGETGSNDFPTVGSFQGARGGLTDGFVAGVGDPLDCALSVSDVTVQEGGPGTNATATFTVSLPRAPIQTVTVDYATASGSASAGSDYGPESGTLAFDPGVNTRTVSVELNGDGVYEGAETFTLSLSNPVGTATVLKGEGVATILNDDAAPTLAIGDVSVTEGQAGAKAAVFTVSRSGATELPTTVDYATSPGTAASPGDYAQAAGTLTFVGSETSLELSVLVAGEATYENDETFFVNLSHPVDGAVVDGQGQGTIVNDDAPPSLSVGDVAVAEGNSGTRMASFTVSLSPPSGLPTTVAFATQDGTASSAAGLGQDYVPASGSLTLPALATSSSIDVVVRGDRGLEPAETFFLSLSGPVNAGLGDGVGQGTITNDDTPGEFQFSAANYGVSEAAPYATITVKRSDFIAVAATVQYSTDGGTATSAAANADYMPAAGTLTFAPTQVSTTFRVAINRDLAAEGEESILLRLANPQPTAQGARLGRQSTAVLTIQDNDKGGQIQLAAVDYSILESAGAVTLTLKRTGGFAPVSVRYATAEVTATDGTDYSGTSTGVVSFGSSGASATNQTITIPVAADADSEGAETFTVSLFDAAGGAALGAVSQARVTILDDEASVEFASAGFEVKESEASAVVTVRRSGPLGAPLAVAYATGHASDTALPGSDYLAASGVLTFAPNVSSATFLLPIGKDTLVEPSETVTLTLSSPTPPVPLGGANPVTLTIVDDDVVPMLQFGAALHTVGEAATWATVPVTRTGNMADRVSIGYAVAGGSATNVPSLNVDYVLRPGALIFDAGVTTQSLRIPVVNDFFEEGTETVLLKLQDPQNLDHPGQAALGGVDSATLLILDDEPTVQFAAAAYSAREAGKAVTLTVKRTGILSAAASVKCAVTGGSAVPDTGSGGDYVPFAPVTLVFGPGQATQSFSITLRADVVAEGAETIELTLSNATGTRLGTPHQAVVTLADDDTAGQAQFAAASFSQAEIGLVATITITRSGTAAGASVHYATLADHPSATAVAGTDYTPTSGTLTFGPGETTQTFMVPVLDNGVPDGGAVSVVLGLDTPGGGLTLGAVSEAILWIVRE